MEATEGVNYLLRSVHNVKLKAMKIILDLETVAMKLLPMN